jgi:hypothetical protein
VFVSQSLAAQPPPAVGTAADLHNCSTVDMFKARAQAFIDSFCEQFSPPSGSNNDNDGITHGPLDNSIPVGGVDKDILESMWIPEIPEEALVREIPEDAFEDDVHDAHSTEDCRTSMTG